MGLTNNGCANIAAALIGAQTPLFDATHAYIGVGDGTATFDKTQNDLQGASRTRVPMDATYPKVTGNMISFRGTFGGTQANYAWNEWAVFNAASVGDMFSRLKEYNGTKLAGQNWIFQVDLTINAT